MNPVGLVEPSVGVRGGILTQARNKVDLSVGVQYNNVGFSEATGEFELSVAVGHHWDRLALVGNVMFGQGLDEAERDGEVRVAALYRVHRLVTAGLDLRARFDLGDETERRRENKIESEFDFIGGPLCTVALGPVALLAQGGVHTIVQHEVPTTGAVVFAGLGATY